MPRKKRPTWTPATTFTVIKLRPNGPKQGQSYQSWSAGKDNADKKWDRLRTENLHKLL